MLPSHLLRMVSLCISGDYQDAAVRARIKESASPSSPSTVAKFWPAVTMAGTYARLVTSAR